jgi:hypothetical protein
MMIFVYSAGLSRNAGYLAAQVLDAKGIDKVNSRHYLKLYGHYYQATPAPCESR